MARTCADGAALLPAQPSPRAAAGRPAPTVTVTVTAIVMRRRRSRRAQLLAAAPLATALLTALAACPATHSAPSATAPRRAAAERYGDEPGFVWARALPADSNCSGALRPAAGGAIAGVSLRPAAQARAALVDAAERSAMLSDLTELRRRNAAVGMVNVGEGTTGTRGVFIWMGKDKSNGGMGIPGVHFKRSIALPPNHVDQATYREAMLATWGLLRQCTAAAPNVEPLPWQPGACLKSNALNSLFSVVQMGLSSGAVHVSDTPYNGVAMDVLKLVPDTARWLLTVRDPLVWAEKRVLGHGHVPICRREWAANASSWFNIAECIAAAGDARLALETQTQSVHRDVCDGAASSDKPHTVLAQKHVLHNTFLVEMLRSQRKDLREMCLWDDGGLNALAGAHVGGELLPWRTVEEQQAMAHPSTSDNGYDESKYTDLSTCAVAREGFNALRDGAISRQPTCGYQGRGELALLVRSEPFHKAVQHAQPLDSPLREPLDVTLPVVGLGLPHTGGLDVASFLACHSISSAYTTCTCEARTAVSWTGKEPPTPPGWARAQCGRVSDCGCLTRACAAHDEPLLSCAPGFEAVFGLEGVYWMRETNDWGKCALPQVTHLQKLVHDSPGATFVLTLPKDAEDWVDEFAPGEIDAMMACREPLGLAPLQADHTSSPALRLAAMREIIEAHTRAVKAALPAGGNSGGKGARLVMVGDGPNGLQKDLPQKLGGERYCSLRHKRNQLRGHKPL